jgi:hypothetical protein
MAAKKTNESLAGLLSPSQELYFKNELEQMAEAYYEYLRSPLSTADIIYSQQDMIDSYGRELAKVENLINKGLLQGEFIADKVSESQPMLKPKIGMRRLPDFLTHWHLADVYDLVLSKNDIKVWKAKDYDILMGIEIAQCRALHNYKKSLEEKLSKLHSSKTQKRDVDIEITSFEWIAGKDKLHRLYEKLKEAKIIDCEQAPFAQAFNKSKLKDMLNIKWLLRGQNGQVSKFSLFYFLEELQNRKFISAYEGAGMSDRIQKIFTDYKGRQLNNLKQSKINIAKKADKMKIDNILKSL